MGGSVSFHLICFLFSANLGGLLGLSMGCSMISIAELFILPMKNILCNKRKKTVEQDE